MKDIESTNKKHDVHAVFLDIDGTLLSGGCCHPENIKAIAEAQAAGHKILLNTGRSYSFIPWNALSEISFDGICAGCGSYVEIGGRVLRSVALENDFVATVADAYKKSGRCLFMEGEQACFWINPQSMQRANKMLSSAQYPCFEVKDGEHFTGEFGEHRISKFTFWGEDFDLDDKAMWERKLRVIVHPTYAESVIYGCDKALGMQVALDALGISRKHSISMGDSANDIEMLEYAGISVAMGNSTDEVKGMCDYVSTNAADGGVAKALRELLGSVA